MSGSHRKRSAISRHRIEAIATALAATVGVVAFLVLSGVATSRAAKGVLHRGDAAGEATTAPALAKAAASAGAVQNRPSAAMSASAVRVQPAPTGSRQTVRGAVGAAAAAAEAAGPGGAFAAPASSGAKTASADDAASVDTAPSPSVVSVAAPATPGTTSAPGATSTTTSTTAAPAGYVAPTVISTALTGCTVDAGGGGVVSYTVDFQGGTNWAPGSNFSQGQYHLTVVGGNGANSGLDAVINGASVEDTADHVATYVLFPASMVLDASC